MDSMLARAGVDDEGRELSGPTQVQEMIAQVTLMHFVSIFLDWYWHCFPSLL